MHKNPYISTKCLKTDFSFFIPPSFSIVLSFGANIPILNEVKVSTATLFMKTLVNAVVSYL